MPGGPPAEQGRSPRRAGRQGPRSCALPRDPQHACGPPALTEKTSSSLTGQGTREREGRPAVALGTWTQVRAESPVAEHLFCPNPAAARGPFSTVGGLRPDATFPGPGDGQWAGVSCPSGMAWTWDGGLRGGVGGGEEAVGTRVRPVRGVQLPARVASSHCRRKARWVLARGPLRDRHPGSPLSVGPQAAQLYPLPNPCLTHGPPLQPLPRRPPKAALPAPCQGFTG